MKRWFSMLTVGLSAITFVFAQPGKPIIGSPNNNAVNVALQPNIDIYLNTSFADSFIVEIDSSASFNSVGLKTYKSYGSVCQNCVKLPKIQFGMAQTWYVRSRAWLGGKVGVWSNTHKFTTIYKALPQQNATAHVDYTAVMPEYLYSFSATNVQYEVSESSSFTTTLTKGQIYPHDSFEGNYYTTMYVRLRGLPQNKTLYMRSRYFLRKDTAAWGPTHTFALKYKPEILNTSGTINTLSLVPSVNLAIYVYNNYTDTSVFYEYQRASDSFFTNPASFKTIEYFTTVNLKPGVNYIRYRVLHQGLTTAWSNKVSLTTYSSLPAPILSSQGNAFRTAQANFGPNLTVVQWQADTTVKFNSARLITWDSIYNPQNFNKYVSFRSDDFAKYRNCYLRYRTGNGTDWMPWSAPSQSIFWQLQGSTMNQNFTLSQQFDFFPMNGVTGYYIQCDVDSLFKSPKAFSVNVSTALMSVTVNDILLNNQTFYYKISARSAKGLSTPKIYGITNNIVPTIWGPGSGQSFAESVPYTIAGKSGSAEMEFQVAKDLAFTKLDGVFISASGGNSGDLPVSAPGGYFFRVRYVNSRSKGVWSTIVPFSITKVSEMAPPILRSPAKGAINVDSKKSKFVWNQVPGANQYLISVYEKATGKLFYQNFTDSTWVWVNELPANKLCKWDVLAMGDKSSKKYSASWDFVTDAMVSIDSDPEKLVGPSPQLYPVPVNDLLWIRNVIVTVGETLSVYDGLGNCIYSMKDSESQNVNLEGSNSSLKLLGRSANGLDLGLDVSALTPGVYYLKLGSATARFVVSR